MGYRPVHDKPFLPSLSRFALFQRSPQQRHEFLAIRPVCSQRQSDVGVLYGERTTFDQRHAGDNIRRNRIGRNHLPVVRLVHRQPFVGSRTCGARRCWQVSYRRSALSIVSFRGKPGDVVPQKDEPIPPFPSTHRHNGTSLFSRTRRFETGNHQPEHQLPHRLRESYQR